VNLVESIASNQQENAKEIKKVASVQQEIKQQQEENAKEIKKIASKSCESESVESSKQALVSSLVSEFVFHISLLLTHIDDNSLRKEVSQ